MCSSTWGSAWREKESGNKRKTDKTVGERRERERERERRKGKSPQLGHHDGKVNGVFQETVRVQWLSITIKQQLSHTEDPSLPVSHTCLSNWSMAYTVGLLR